MKKTYIAFGILGLILVSTLAYAFDLIETTPIESHVVGDDALSWYHVETNNTIDEFVLQMDFDNLTTTMQFRFKDDGTWTYNGKGVCLDDGTSTNGGLCFRPPASIKP